jgi:hypothetical protein
MTGTVIKSIHSAILAGNNVDACASSRPQRHGWTLTRAPLIGAFTLTLGVLFTPAQGQSLRTYVSGTGNDSNACGETSPCLTLQGALTKTLSGGQIYALSSANYGYVTIDKAVSIISGRGATGVLAASSISGITINAGASDIINLQGLDIDGTGAGANGILFSSGASLNVKDSTIRGFATGISFQPAGASALSVAGTLISNNTTGIVFQSATTSTGVLSDVQVVNNSTGVTVLGASSTGQAIVTAQGCIVANNSGVGVQASSYSAVTVTDCTVANNGVGLAAQSDSALLQASGSTVAGNGTGWQVSNSGQVISASNNSIGGNTAGNAAPPTSTTPPPNYVAKNIVTDFGAICDGVADDAPAFTAFNTWAVNTWQVSTAGLIQLTIPSGKTCQFLSDPGRWAQNIKKLLVIGYGASLVNNRSAPVALGGQGLRNSNAFSARLATVSAGSQSVTLLTPSQSSLFRVGNYAVITGLDLQGLWQRPYGFPPNPHFFEYVKVTAIDAGTGVVTFETPLRNTYKSTWPNYNSGNAFEVDAGGPATLYALHPSWDTEVEYRGLTIAQPNSQTYAVGRSVTYRDVTFTGAHCGIPTENQLWQAINSDFSTCTMEVDKIITTMALDGVTIRKIYVQSSSTDLMTIKNSTITLSVEGTPKKAVVSDSTIQNLRLGATGYGRSDEFVGTNLILPAFNTNSVIFPNINQVATMSGGLITIPNTQNAQSWAVPGTNLMWYGQAENETAFQVIDVTQDATNTYVRTNLSGGFPPVQLYNGTLSLLVHPSPKFTCTNCTGSADAVDLSQTPAGAPIYSYSKRTYTGSTITVSPAAQFKMWGRLSSFKYNVTTPYTGTLALTMNALSQFNNSTTYRTDYTTFTYGPVINLKIAGERAVTPSSFTGQKTGDVGLSVPEAVWFTGIQAAGPIISRTVSGETCNSGPTPCFSITIEQTTDQGVVNP